jgi:hypothetical protein
MNCKQILTNVMYSDNILPKNDIEIILNNKEQFYPLIVEEIIKCVNNKNILLEPEYASCILFSLIGDLACHEAFDPLIDILKNSDNIDNDYFGDMLFVNMPIILTKIFDNAKIDIIIGLIQNEKIYEGVRVVLLLCIVLLEITGKIDVDLVKKIVFDNLNHLLTIDNYKECDNYLFLDNIFMLCLHYKFDDASPLVNKFFDNGMVDQYFTGNYKEFCRILKKNTYVENDIMRLKSNMTLNTIDTLSNWHYYKLKPDKPEPMKEKQFLKPEPVVLVDRTTKKKVKPNRHERLIEKKNIK